MSSARAPVTNLPSLIRYLSRFVPTCLSVKWYWQSFRHRSRSSVRVPSWGHTWPRLTRSLPSVRHCMMFSCRLAGSSVSVMPVDVDWRRKKKCLFFFLVFFLECCFTSYQNWIFPEVPASYFFDLYVVQLLLPLHDVLHAVHPDVDVAHQHGLAHVLNQAAQRHVEHLKQLLDGPHVLLVIQDCGECRDVKPTERTNTVVWTRPEAAIIKLNIFEQGSCNRFCGTT